MRFAKYFATEIALILFNGRAIAEEEIVLPPPATISNEELSIPYSGKQFSSIRTKKILYGSVSIAPGAGIEFRHGFIDIGAKILLGIIPIPEIRAGIHLKFKNGRS